MLERFCRNRNLRNFHIHHERVRIEGEGGHELIQLVRREGLGLRCLLLGWRRVGRSLGEGSGHAPHAPLTLRVDWSDASHRVPEAIGQECPAYVFANFNDQAYGRFLLNAVSQSAMTPSVPQDDPLLHVMLWEHYGMTSASRSSRRDPFLSSR